MEEYKPNSHRSKEERKESIPEKHVEKVISGTVKPKKKSEMQKFADVFISEDVNNVKSYIVMDVLVPAIKKAISDIVTNGIDMILYGEAGKSKKNSTHEHCVFAEYLNSADSSYLNRPIVGPTPPKLPAHSSNLRYHRVLTCSRKCLYIIQYFQRKVKCLHKIFSIFLCKSEFFALCTKTDPKTIVSGLFCPISIGNNR